MTQTRHEDAEVFVRAVITSINLRDTATSPKTRNPAVAGFSMRLATRAKARGRERNSRELADARWYQPWYQTERSSQELRLA
jgi:hypothetical protein